MTGILRVDTIQNSNTSTIITQTNSTTITIGTSGQTVALAAGSSQTGFGRAGSVNWDTTPKTANFTAVSGNGYFVDTNTTAITVTLPATPAAGDIVAIADYANTSATNNITVGRNSSPIDGEAVDATIKINGQVYTLVYVDATEGWKTVGQTFNQINTAEFVAATGGTITTCGDCKIHTFTGPGTFTITSAGNPLGSNSVDYLVIAGGGGGSADGNQPQGGAGGGAGGFRQSFPNPATAGFPITATAYPITVGAGGAGSTGTGCKGSDSVFSTITSTGGGQGGVYNNVPGYPGGSGGGGGAGSSSSGGSGNSPPTSPPQGNNGSGAVGPSTPGAGGGAGSAGSGQNGGNGTTSTIGGSPVTRGGGGASGVPGGSAGPGGGGARSTAGGTNTGGGGGGGNSPGCNGKSGGSGIVIIRYKYQ